MRRPGVCRACSRNAATEETQFNTKCRIHLISKMLPQDINPNYCRRSPDEKSPTTHVKCEYLNSAESVRPEDCAQINKELLPCWFLLSLYSKFRLIAPKTTCKHRTSCKFLSRCWFEHEHRFESSVCSRTHELTSHDPYSLCSLFPVTYKRSRTSYKSSRKIMMGPPQ